MSFDKTMDNMTLLWQLRQLHQELSGYYHRGATDQRAIDIIWNSIETLEAIARQEGMDYE